jgi:hypothetical protein
MKITITKKIQQELEVPQYWTNPNSVAVFKLLSYESCMMVIANERYPSIGYTSADYNFSETSFEITEQVFNLRLNEAKQYLNL